MPPAAAPRAAGLTKSSIGVDRAHTAHRDSEAQRQRAFGNSNAAGRVQDHNTVEPKNVFCVHGTPLAVALIESGQIIENTKFDECELRLSNYLCDTLRDVIVPMCMKDLDHFVDNSAVQLLKHVAELLADDPTRLSVYEVTLSQLAPHKDKERVDGVDMVTVRNANPDLDRREDEWVGFAVNKKAYVRAPGNNSPEHPMLIYRIMEQRQRSSSTRFIFKIAGENSFTGDYGMKLTWSKRGKEHNYDYIKELGAETDQSMSVSVEPGYIVSENGSTRFNPCAQFQLKYVDKGFRQSPLLNPNPLLYGMRPQTEGIFTEKHKGSKCCFLFVPNKWPAFYQTDAPDDEDLRSIAAEGLTAIDSQHTHRFVVDDLGQTCIVKPGKKGADAVNEVRATFTIEAMYTLSYPDDRSKTPEYVVLISHNTPLYDGEVLRIPLYEEVPPSLDGLSRIEVEHQIAPGVVRQHSDVWNMFQRIHANFQCSMQPVEFMAWIMQTFQGLEGGGKYCITRWGLQKDKEQTIVLSNTAVRRGQLLPLEDSGYVYDPHYFYDHPTAPAENWQFPSIRILQPDWVRVAQFKYFYNVTAPDVFTDINKVASRLAMAAAIRALNYNEFDKQPFILLFSADGQTTKTAAMRVAAAMLGINDAGGGDCTKPQLLDQTTLVSSLLVCIDELSPPDVDHNYKSTIFRQVSHTLYDRMARKVRGRQSVPLSQMMTTSNFLYNATDGPNQSRLLMIEFARPLVGAIDKGDMWERFNAACGMLGGCLPDTSLIGKIYVEGEWKLDKKGMDDVGTLLKTVLDKNRDRLITSWQEVIFFALNAHYLLDWNGDTAFYDELFDVVITKLTRGYDVQMKFTNPIDRLLVAIIQMRRNNYNPTGPTNRTIFLHNFRAEYAHPLAPAKKFYAIALQAVIDVINNVDKVLHDSQKIMDEIGNGIYADACFSDARFYDTSKQGWPATTDEKDEVNNVITKRPLRESELDDEITCVQQALLIPLPAVKLVDDALKKMKPKPAFKDVWITSEVDKQRYHFMAALKDGTSPVLRSAKQHLYAKWPVGEKLEFDHERAMQGGHDGYDMGSQELIFDAIELKRYMKKHYLSQAEINKLPIVLQWDPFVHESDEDEEPPVKAWQEPWGFEEEPGEEEGEEGGEEESESEPESESEEPDSDDDGFIDDTEEPKRRRSRLAKHAVKRRRKFVVDSASEAESEVVKTVRAKTKPGPNFAIDSQLRVSSPQGPLRDQNGSEVGDDQVIDQMHLGPDDINQFAEALGELDDEAVEREMDEAESPWGRRGAEAQQLPDGTWAIF